MIVMHICMIVINMIVDAYLSVALYTSNFTKELNSKQRKMACNFVQVHV